MNVRLIFGIILILALFNVRGALDDELYPPSTETPPTQAEPPEWNSGVEQGGDVPTGGFDVPETENWGFADQPQYNQEDGPRLRDVEYSLYDKDGKLISVAKATRIDTDPDQELKGAILTLFPDYTYINNASYTKIDDVELGDYEITNLYSDGSYAGHKFREIKHGNELRAIDVDEAKYNTKDWIAKKANYVEAEETKKL